MSISKFMTQDPVTIGLDDNLEKVKAIFETRKFHHLLVVDNDKLLGIISDRDYLKAISPNVDRISASEKDLATLNKRTHQIMTPNPKIVRANDPLEKAVDLFRSERVSCLPVLDENDLIIGILTLRNILDAIHVKRRH